MKYITEKEDIEYGSYIVRQQDDSEHIEDTGYLSTIMYKIGYSMNPTKIAKIAMSDGWVYTFDSKEEILKSLKERNYRFATKEEVLRVINYQDKYTQDNFN